MSTVNEECVKRIAGLRAECLESGIEPAVLGDLLVEEALLAWMMHGLSEQQIHQRATEKLRRDLREWFFRARAVTGQCDCVREVHMNGMVELKQLLLTPVPESDEAQQAC
jgi:hypothetical protein